MSGLVEISPPRPAREFFVFMTMIIEFTEMEVRALLILESERKFPKLSDGDNRKATILVGTSTEPQSIDYRVTIEPTLPF